MLQREARALREKGFQVDIISLRQWRTDKIFQRFDDLNLYLIQSRAERERNALLYFLRLFLFFCTSFLLLTFLGLRRKYDLVHVTAPPDFMVFTALVPKLMGGEIILDIHDIGPELYMRKLQANEGQLVIKFIKYLERISARFADHVLTVTELWREKLISRSVPESKCSVLLNVPDDGIFKPTRSARPKVTETINLYYHGLLDERAGVDTLISAMPIIKRELPNAKLHIYGSGPLSEELKLYARKHNIDDVVILHGNVPFYELPMILANADIGIVPTKDAVFSDEILAQKSLEYLSLGIPIVVSKNKGHSYYFNSNMVRFFKPNDRESLARSIIDVCRSPKEREKLLNNSKKFLERHNWKVYKTHYVRIVEQLLSIKL
jgi:glycosyltransferase involved in cell wall biosynthesis